MNNNLDKVILGTASFGNIYGIANKKEIMGEDECKKIVREFIEIIRT